MSFEQQREALADLWRGYHGVPHDDKLKAMSDIELDSLLHSSKRNPVKVAAVEREIIRRRNAALVQNPPTGPSDDKPSEAENPKPISLTRIFESVVASILAACLLYLIAKHFDVHLRP